MSRRDRQMMPGSQVGFKVFRVYIIIPPRENALYHVTGFGSRTTSLFYFQLLLQKVIFIWFLICWPVFKKRGMFFFFIMIGVQPVVSSERGWMLVQSGLTYMPTLSLYEHFSFFLLTFTFTVVCDDVSIFSIIVSHRIVPSAQLFPPHFELWCQFLLFLTELWDWPGSSSGQVRCQAPPVPLHHLRTHLHRADGRKCRD